MKVLKETFIALDKNGDGSLTLEELRHGLSDFKNSEEIMELMKAADTDKSGTINYTGISIHIKHSQSSWPQPWTLKFS